MRDVAVVFIFVAGVVAFCSVGARISAVFALAFGAHVASVTEQTVITGSVVVIMQTGVLGSAFVIGARIAVIALSVHRAFASGGVIETFSIVAAVGGAFDAVAAVFRGARGAGSARADIAQATVIAVVAVGLVVDGDASTFAVTLVVGTDIAVVAAGYALRDVTSIVLFIAEVGAFGSAVARVSSMLTLAFATSIFAVTEEPVVASSFIIAVDAAVLSVTRIIGTRIAIVALFIPNTLATRSIMTTISGFGIATIHRALDAVVTVFWSAGLT